MAVPSHIADLFPELTPANADQTSPEDPCYNCIAYAVGEQIRWWWPYGRPNAYWPPGIPRELTVRAFRAVFELNNYVACDSDELVDGVEKVAIFVDEDGDPSHAARQLPAATWTSKIGDHEDISHPLRELEGATYGRVALIMSRPRQV